MTPHAPKVSAEDFLSAPRSTPPVPNDDGTLGLYTVSTHTFTGDVEGETVKEWRLMDLVTGISERLWVDDKVHSVSWIPGGSLDVEREQKNDIIYLRSEDGGRTRVFVANIKDVTQSHYEIAELEAPIDNVKLKRLGDRLIAFVFTALVGPDGDIFNDEVGTRKSSTARVFDTYNIRVWSEMYKEHLYGLWYTTLSLQQRTWTLSPAHHNILKDTTLELAGLYDVAEATDNFVIHPHGIAFIARDAATRDVRARLDTHPFFCPLSSFSQPPPSSWPPRRITLPDRVGPGESTCMRLSSDDSTVGFLHAPAGDIYNRRLYFVEVGSHSAAADAFASLPETLSEKTYEPPTSFEFASPEGSSQIILLRESRGRSVLVHIDLDAGDHDDPRTLTTEGTVTGFYPLGRKWDRLLVTSSSIVDSYLVQVIDAPTASVFKTLSSSTATTRFGLASEMWLDVYFQGADGLDIHAFVVRPSDFDPARRYPWVLMPHGGPVSAWTDSWSMRWNLAVWAQQGYVIICPNISGSTGFGLAFAKRINDQWGGKPCEDLLLLINYLETLPYLDQAKGVLAGSSYGAYMAGWLMGHDIISKFCCVVWHGGIFNIPTFMLQTDAPTDDAAFAGDPPFPWVNPAALARYNPARPDLLRNWGRLAPPTLVVHGGRDYRCPLTEGLAMFCALQAQGVPSRFLTFEDEGHWVTSPNNALVWHRTVWGWVRRCVDGELKRECHAAVIGSTD